MSYTIAGIAIPDSNGTSFKKNIIDAFCDGMKHRPDSSFEAQLMMMYLH